MADMPYPYYQLQADGPNETGLLLRFQVQTGAGGSLPGISEEQLLAHLKEYLAGTDGNAVRLSSFAVQVTDGL